MDTLDNTQWEVVIDGTGISQSLLALALSRSGKRILHIDRSGYYGDGEAALSLQEAAEWAKRVNEGYFQSRFLHASIEVPTESTAANAPPPQLSFSRAYSIALGPQLIYAKSALLDYLVQANVHPQLEFLAMGSWWICSPHPTTGSDNATTAGTHKGDSSPPRLTRIPTSREEIAFSDVGLDLRAKRSLIRLMRFIMNHEEQHEIWNAYRARSLSEFLQEKFSLPPDCHGIVTALALSPYSAQRTITGFALPRVAQHLQSIGRLGIGFSSVIPRWGGLSEVCQVACRAAAVGGAVYALNRTLEPALGESADREVPKSRPHRSSWILENGDTVQSTLLVECEKFPDVMDQHAETNSTMIWTRSITIVRGSVSSLMPAADAVSPPPAGALIAFPTGSLPSVEVDGEKRTELPPVYFIIHSHDTGECPPGQFTLYSSTAFSGAAAQLHLENATRVLRDFLIGQGSQFQKLWSLRYEQTGGEAQVVTNSQPLARSVEHNRIIVPSPNLDLVFDDSVFQGVKTAWQRLIGNEVDEKSFLKFSAREDAIED